MATKKKYRAGGQPSLLTSLEGRLDMTVPGSTNNVYMKGKDCGCSKKMNMGGTVPTANTYFGKR
jgi:hypothetical protein